MKKIFFVLVCLVITQDYFAQKENPNLNSMIATEYSFAATAEKLGTRDAFLNFIADDGILFRPGPLNGKKYLSESKPSGGLLSWYPSFALVSKAGDLGFTSGPWEWRKNKTDSAALAFGNFCTVWQKEQNGEWKFAIDHGISNEKPAAKPIGLKAEKIKLLSTPSTKGIENKKENPGELLELDKQFATTSSDGNTAATYRKFTNEESRLLRDENFPIIGTKNISEYVATNSGKYKFNPVGGKISSSKDIGFTYGELVVSGKNEKVDEHFNYVHFWKKDGKRWIILIDVANQIKK